MNKNVPIHIDIYIYISEGRDKKIKRSRSEQGPTSDHANLPGAIGAIPPENLGTAPPARWANMYMSDSA